MAAAYPHIARVLDGARRRQGAIVLATGLAWGVAGALALLLAGAAWLAARPDARVARAAAITGAFAVLAAAVGWCGLALRRRAGAPESVARALGDAVPALRSDLVSAVELEVGGDAAFSRELVEEHAARTAARAVALDLRAAVPSAGARRALSILALAALVNLLALAAAGRPLVAGYERLAGSSPAVKGPSRAPITGDVELTYRYPAYMHREPRTVAGTGGEIHAPKGTEVGLRARADRDVGEAQLVLDGAVANPVRPEQPVRPEGAGSGRPEPFDRLGAGEVEGRERPELAGQERPPAQTVLPLTVTPPRDLAGSLVVGEPGTYRFRYTRGKKVLAEGPPLAVTVEPDLAPEVRIVRPKAELEVQPDAKVPLEWTASDDFGLAELTLVVRRAGGAEERRKLRALEGSRREGGTETLDVSGLRLAEGERAQYWLEATDEDSVSGPKRGVSATHVLTVYSEAEHRRLALRRAQELWEALVGHTGERLEFFARGREWTPPRMAEAQAMDGRSTTIAGQLTAGAAELRRDRAVPRELAQALANVGASVGKAAQAAASLREALARALALRRGADSQVLAPRVEKLDARLDEALERGVLYLEQLMDQERADDLVRLAKELQSRRRELAALAEHVRDAPTDEAKRALLAEVQALRRRLDELGRRMAELAKGMNDEHLNAEALAEAARANDAGGQLDEIERAIRDGDLDGALAKLDRMGQQMDELVAGMQRAQKRPGQQNRELARELRALKGELSAVEGEQKRLADETEKERQAYRREVQRRMQRAEEKVARLERLAREARKGVEQTRPGVTPRTQHDLDVAQDRLGDLERALAARDLDAALDSARRALTPVERLASGLDEDLQMVQRFPGLSGAADLPRLRDARDQAARAVPPAREVKQELEKLFPDPRELLPPEAQARLGQQSERQGELARRSGALRQKLEELSSRTPVLPQDAGEALREAEQQMDGAAGELSRRDPQRGGGRQRQALDALARLQAGMEKMGGKGGAGEDGMPMPFAMQPGGGEEGEGLEPSQEKVEIPGAEAWKAPEAFRRDLMDAMKQAKPKPYEDEVTRYYREIVK